MIERLPLTKVLFLDVETVSGTHLLQDLNEEMQYLWRLKAAQLLKKPKNEIKEEELNEFYQDRAAIYAEFGKIVCISVGLIVNEAKDKMKVRLKSFYGFDEKKLLEEFAELMGQYFHDVNTHFICGHNLREFDIPYICRRMVVQGIQLPTMLQLHGKKPWETKYLLDTMDLWKFGDYKHYSSLKLLTAIFGIPTPKDDIDGSEVGRVFWEEKDIERIAIYCEKDVIAVIQIMMKFKRMDTFEPDQITSLLTESNT